jgi:hypothetical protein
MVGEHARFADRIIHDPAIIEAHPQPLLSTRLARRLCAPRLARSMRRPPECRRSGEREEEA